MYRAVCLVRKLCHFWPRQRLLPYLSSVNKFLKSTGRTLHVGFFCLSILLYTLLVNSKIYWHVAIAGIRIPACAFSGLHYDSISTQLSYFKSHAYSVSVNDFKWSSTSRKGMTVQKCLQPIKLQNLAVLSGA